MGNERRERPGSLNWYPGHMKKTRELIISNLKLVDAVIEVIDARIPISSRNPIIDDLVKSKPRIITLNKCDLADPAQNRLWTQKLTVSETTAIAIDCRSGRGIDKVFNTLQALQDKKNSERTRKRAIRIMIVGVPNVGKSSLINRLTGRKSAQTGNKPGVTRGKQWLTLKNGMQLLDTPGILWPKFEDQHVGLNLAFCGSIKDEIMDQETLAFELIKYLMQDCSDLLAARYKIDDLGDDALTVMDQIARKRGFIFSGERIDYERTSRTIVDEFRSAKIGRITLEQL